MGDKVALGRQPVPFIDRQVAVEDQRVRSGVAGGFGEIGVNLDTDPAVAKKFLADNKIGWEHLYDAQGIDGERATTMGVINLPLMMLVDSQGRVVNRSLTAGELEAELQRGVR